MALQNYNFPQIYEAYRSRIKRYLARLASENEADDLCQEVFVKVDKGLKNFRAEAQLSTWIYRIATNTALDRLRSASFKQQREEVAADSPSRQSIESTDKNVWTIEKRPDAEHQVIRQEMNRYRPPPRKLPGGPRPERGRRVQES